MPGEKELDYSIEQHTLLNPDRKEPTESHAPIYNIMDPIAQKETQEEYVIDIKKEMPQTTDFRTILERNNWEGELARANCIATDKVVGMAFEGFDVSPLKYLEGKPLWEFEPKGKDFLERWTNLVNPDHDRSIITEAATSGNKAKIWKMLEETTALPEVREKLGELDLHSLTPYEATYLVGTLISTKMQYDSIAFKYLDRVRNGTGKTGKPEMLDLYDKNPEKFETQNARYNQRLDNLPADKLLENGWGVCRHFSSCACYIYETLKEKQQANFLNGTYLLPYPTSSGINGTNTGHERHEINLLVVTAPQTETASQKIFLGVLDATKAVQDIEHFDETMLGFYAIPQFIKNFGEEFGIDKPASEAILLADDMVHRMETLFANDGTNEITKFLNTYVSLVSMSSIGEKGQLIPHVIETLSTNKYGNKCMILENLFEIPAVSREFYLSADIKPMRIIRRDYVPQIYQEISTIDFAKINPVPGEHSTYCEDVEALFNTVQENFIAMASIKDNKQFEGYVNGYPMDIVTDTLVRAYVQAEKTPSADIVAMVEKVDKALKRFHRGQLTQSLLEKFTDLAKE